MRPFQQFQLWVRKAPGGERVTAAVAAAVAVALLVWLVLPPSPGPASTVSASGGSVSSGAPGGSGASGGAGGGGATGGGSGQPGPAAGGGTGGAAGAGGGASTAAGGSAGGGAGSGRGSGGTGSAPTATGSTSPGAGQSGTAGVRIGSSGCVSPPGSDQGVTASQIKIALMLVDIAGATANATFDVPPASEQQADYQAIIDDINSHGGVACRKLVPQYFTINPLDQANLQQTCLNVAQAGVFYANDLGGYAAYPAITSCYAQHHIPFFSGNFLPEGQLEQSYPYLFAGAAQEVVFFNLVTALKQLGFFDPAKGFKKLGYFYASCVAQNPAEVQNWLHQAGVPASQIVTYDLGCPVTLVFNPSDVEAAELKFQQAGVTNVIETGADSAWDTFTSDAERQSYHPRYGLPDQSISYSSNGSSQPDWANANGSLLITPYRFGEEHTPGYVPSAATQRCNKIMAAHNRPPAYSEALGMSGVACDQLWFFVSAVTHAPQLKRTALAAGLYAGGPIDFAYPYGPGSFPSVRTTFPQNSWRVLTAFSSCSCWRVTDATFHAAAPGFQWP